MRALLALRERQTWVWLHRWVGLVMTIFLVVAGLTGSLLAFYEDLDSLVNPALLRVTPPTPDAPMLDPITLHENARAARPGYVIDSALTPYKRHHALMYYMYWPDESVPYDNELFVNPYTGEVLGSRRAGDLSQGMVNLMPFIFHLHYSFALGAVGTLAFGIISLLWTLDCFIGAYLTMPRGRPFFEKWRPSWGIQRKRFNYDLHRASGLWTWAILFVLAWSSVALNLPSVYHPVTAAVLGITAEEQLPERNFDQPEPGLQWRDAYARGRELMQPAIAKYGIANYREDALRYDDHRAEFNYWIVTRFRGDEAYEYFDVSFDANTGELLRINEEDIDQERAGDFVTRWILDLHMARVWGMPYRIFLCFMGIVITALSVTGVVIWWRKRRGRVRTRRNAIVTG